MLGPEIYMYWYLVAWRFDGRSQRTTFFRESDRRLRVEKLKHLLIDDYKTRVEEGRT
jgi:hypothetical protein